MLYAGWLELLMGCVKETSDDREYLEGEAEAWNTELQQQEGMMWSIFNTLQY